MIHAKISAGSVSANGVFADIQQARVCADSYAKSKSVFTPIKIESRTKMDKPTLYWPTEEEVEEDYRSFQRGVMRAYIAALSLVAMCILAIFW